MNEEEILHKMRAVFQDCQKQALALRNNTPAFIKASLQTCNLQVLTGLFWERSRSTTVLILKRIQSHQKLVDALAKTDSQAIGILREEIYLALDQMQPEHYASYIFLTCFPSIYKAMGEK